MVVITGLCFGGVFTLVTLRQHMQFLTPLLIGFGASMILGYAIWRARVWSVLDCVLAGILLTVLVYGAYQVANYFVFRKNMADMLALESEVTLDPAEIDQQIDAFLLDNAGQTGFNGFIQFQLNTGMVIRSSPPVFGEQVLGSRLLFYWAVDAATILAITLLGVRYAVRRRYCPTCHKYYGSITLSYGDYGFERLGWLARKSESEFLDGLARDHLEQAGALLQVEKPGRDAVDVLVERCDTCSTGPVSISVSRSRGAFSSQRTWRVRRELTPEQYERLISFADVGQPKPVAGGVNRWLLEMLVVIGFLCAMMLAYGFVAGP